MNNDLLGRLVREASENEKALTELQAQLKRFGFFVERLSHKNVIFLLKKYDITFDHSMESLELPEKNIKDISEFQFLTKLKTLDLHENNIVDISSLSSLTDLVNLNLYKNKISDISPLENLHNLEHLSLSGNSIANISALTNLTNLKSLDLLKNSISDLSPLYKLINLKSLIIDVISEEVRNRLPNCRIWSNKCI